MRAVEKVEEHIADATAKGAMVATGGGRPRPRRQLLPADPAHRRHPRDGGGARGDVRSGRAAVPLLPPRTRRCAMANDTEFGLAAYFYSRDRRPRMARLRGSRIRDRGRQRVGSSRTKWRRSAASRSRGSAARGRSTASTTSSRSSTSAWEGSTARVRDRVQGLPHLRRTRTARGRYVDTGVTGSGRKRRFPTRRPDRRRTWPRSSLTRRGVEGERMGGDREVEILDPGPAAFRFGPGLGRMRGRPRRSMQSLVSRIKSRERLG